MFGWRGHMAKIDLSAGIVSIEKTDPDACENFIGGRGMAGYLLKDHITLAWDDPDMPILFFTGPLVDTASPTSGRMTVMSKSPLTGTVGDASVGGTFGTMLKRAGLDGLVITGKSENLCGIDIADHRITIVPAAGLAGKFVDEVNTLLTPGAATAVIGPAAVTGVPATSRTLSLIGERICFQERIMSARLGFAAEDDDLPRRFFEQTPTDPDAGVIHPINREEFVKARSAYYKIRGLDGNGRPLPEKAETLGLII